MARKPVAEPEPELDMVNHPPHYQSENGVECIDAIRGALGRDGFIAFLRGTIIAYEWRCTRKDDPLRDAAKAGWYNDKLKEVLAEDA